MILNIITLISITIAVLFLIVLVVKPVENFTFEHDLELKKKAEVVNNEIRARNRENSNIENNIKKRKTLDKIEEAVDKYENVLNFIRENLNNIPICREIDLRHDLQPDCTKRNSATCKLNPYCILENEMCVNKELNSECGDILYDDNGNYTGKPKSMFLYPTMLEEIK